jgi:hypothetical protein
MIDFLYDRKLQFYYCLEKAEGQLLHIRFQEEIYSKKAYYSVFFEIVNKRKHKEKVTLKETGKMGLKGLLWAKIKIKEFMIFINDIRNQFLNKNVYIIVRWDDNRRRKAYEWGLKDLGFKINYIFGKKVLVKKI